MIGMPKAVVLPVPVRDSTMRSRPERAIGMDLACTSVACPYPMAPRDSRIGAGRSSDENGTGTDGKAERSCPSRRAGGGGGGSRGEPRGRIATTRIWRSFPDFFEAWSIPGDGLLDSEHSPDDLPGRHHTDASGRPVGDQTLPFLGSDGARRVPHQGDAVALPGEEPLDGVPVADVEGDTVHHDAVGAHGLEDGVHVRVAEDVEALLAEDDFALPDEVLLDALLQSHFVLG